MKNETSNKANFKAIMININLGVGFYNCHLSVRVYNDTRAACMVDTATNSHTGAAIISLKDNPEWAKVLDDAVDCEVVDIDGFDFDEKLMKVNNLKIKNNGNVMRFAQGIIYPKAYDYNCKVTFREPYFGKDKPLPDPYPIIIKTEQINEYQVYQRGFTYTIKHDDAHAWADGRLRYEVPGVYREEVENLTYRTRYTVFNEDNKKQYDKVKLLEEDDRDNYLNRLQYAVYTAWRDDLDIRETVREEFSESLYADYL